MYPPDTLVRGTVVIWADVALAKVLVTGVELLDESVVDSGKEEIVVNEAIEVTLVVAFALLTGNPDDGAAVGASTQSQGSVP